MTTELSEVALEDLLDEIYLSRKIVVYNDDVNSFDWVIDCFCNYLKHSPEQAEQCALIIHTKGKASVKNGTEIELIPIKTALDDAGLTCEIE